MQTPEERTERIILTRATISDNVFCANSSTKVGKNCAKRLDYMFKCNHDSEVENFLVCLNSFMFILTWFEKVDLRFLFDSFFFQNLKRTTNKTFC